MISQKHYLSGVCICMSCKQSLFECKEVRFRLLSRSVRSALPHPLHLALGIHIFVPCVLNTLEHGHCHSRWKLDADVGVSMILQFLCMNKLVGGPCKC